MEVSLTAGDLAATVGLVKGIVPAKNTIPILNNVMLSARGSILSVTGTSLDIEGTATVACDVAREGRVTVPGHVLFGLAKALPRTKSLTLSINDGRAILTCGSSRYDLRTLPPDEFPIVNVDETQAQSFSIKSDDLKAALEATARCASTADDRIYLNGVFLCNEGGKLTCVATDSHRLARYYAGDAPIDDLRGVIIPSGMVAQMMNVLSSGAVFVDLVITPERIAIITKDVRVVSKLIAGTYPDYMRVIPTARNSPPNVHVGAGDLAEAAARISVVYSAADTKAPVARCTTNGGTFDLSAGRDDNGTEHIDAEIDQSCDFGVSARYLTEMVGMWPSSARLSISAPTPGSPILFTSTDLPQQTHVIMPMGVIRS